MTDLLQRIETSIHDRSLLKQGGKVLVAVSGGIDSMVLLHGLGKISKRNRWKIVVAHFNHQLRGRASDLDEKLVRKTAARMKLSVIVEGVDIKAFADQSGLSTEMAARKLRHEFLARAARRQKIKTIALAHHADDQVELFFLRLLRGAGGEGLGGMKWKSCSPADKNLMLIRPLLDASKTDLRALAKIWKVPFREDASNASSDFLRNRIRNQLLPMLRKDYQPALTRVILRMMEIVGAESEYVGDVAGSAKVAFEKMPSAIQRRQLQIRLLEAGMIPDFDLIESLRKSSGQFVSISPGISASCDRNGKINLREDSQKKFGASKLAVELTKKAGGVRFNGRQFKWGLVRLVGSVVFNRRPKAQPKLEFFDADKIGNKIILRHWRMGDRFQPIGMKSPVKLQDVFVNAKIPRARRHELVVATTGSGEIFWVEGLRISEHFKLTARTRRRLIWEWDVPVI